MSGEEPGDSGRYRRTRGRVTLFFAGLELIDPGVVLVDQWHATSGAATTAGRMAPFYGAVARKPSEDAAGR